MGLPAYGMKGVHIELVKLGAKDVEAYIVSARIAQGVHEIKEASPETKKYCSAGTRSDCRLSSGDSGEGNSRPDINTKVRV